MTPKIHGLLLNYVIILVVIISPGWERW